MKMYGIDTCDSVKKAMAYFKKHAIDYEFIDLKAYPLSENKINGWLKSVSLDILLNTKGTKYRTLKLKELNLDESGKVKWMVKEPLLIKRPVLELKEGKCHVGYNEKDYDTLFQGQTSP